MSCREAVNRLVAINDYTPFQTTNPLTGETMTLYNLDPAKAGQSLLVRFTNPIRLRWRIHE